MKFFQYETEYLAILINLFFCLKYTVTDDPNVNFNVFIHIFHYKNLCFLSSRLRFRRRRLFFACSPAK